MATTRALNRLTRSWTGRTAQAVRLEGGGKSAVARSYASWAWRAPPRGATATGQRRPAPALPLVMPIVPRRTFMVNTEATPNPESLKFFPTEQKVLSSGTMDFPDARSAAKSPLAKMLFKQEGVRRVFLTSDYVTITKDEEIDWEQMKPIVIGTLMEFYASGQPVMLDEQDLPQDTKILDTDSESVAMIKELLETRIRPAVQDDGGDITYLGFHEGVVFLLMQGSCSGCPSSSVTLKSGIERMLMHWVPEVQGVMAMDSREEYERVINRVVHKASDLSASEPTSSDPEDILSEAKHQSEARKASEEALRDLEERLKSAGDGQGKL